MNSTYIALATSIVGLIKDWRKARKMKLELKSITRAKLAEWEVDKLNADLREYHRTGTVPYDASIAKHVGGKLPTRRIELKPKLETRVKAGMEQK